jgi:signal transduction histidine kinase/CheY-like chemotaxis protein
MTRPERVLIFAPIGKDGTLTSRLLARAELESTLCDSFAALVREFQAGAGAILITEEALEAADLPLFAEALERQPPWSDVPILLFGGSDEIEIRRHTIHLLGTLGNVTLLGRPLHTAAVISTVRAALRSRRRQYDMRDLLVTVRSAREEAEAANRLKDEFLATLSHELRTPLNAVLGWTMMLRNGQLDASRLSHALSVIDRNARLQAQLIEDLLDVSRIISGKLTVRVGRVALVPLLAAALDTVRPAAHAKQIEVDATIVTPDVEVDGDSARLQQVFWNLLTNAVSYTPRGGRISVEVDTAEDHARVTVRDTGVGIAPEFLPHVFERFRQAESTWARPQGGLGLGLAIVHHIVELHGGHITAASEGLGRGATFVVSLPCAPVPAGLRSNPRPAHVEELGALGVLLVTPHAEACAQVASALRARGAIVTPVRSAEEALELVADAPDVLVTDLALPRQNGSSLLATLRALPSARGGALRAIAVLGEGVRHVTDARTLGFDIVVPGPMSPESVLTAIRQLVSLGKP